MNEAQISFLLKQVNSKILVNANDYVRLLRSSGDFVEPDVQRFELGDITYTAKEWKYHLGDMNDLDYLRVRTFSIKILEWFHVELHFATLLRDFGGIIVLTTDGAVWGRTAQNEYTFQDTEVQQALLWYPDIADKFYGFETYSRH